MYLVCRLLLEKKNHFRNLARALHLPPSYLQSLQVQGPASLVYASPSYQSFVVSSPLSPSSSATVLPALSMSFFSSPPPPTFTFFPYTTLFRSLHVRQAAGRKARDHRAVALLVAGDARRERGDRKSTRLNSSHRCISYAVFCLKKKTTSGT